MADRTWITVFFPTPLIFRYHLPLMKSASVHTCVMHSIYRFLFIRMLRMVCATHFIIPCAGWVISFDSSYLCTVQPKACMLGAGQSKKDAWCISQTHDLRFARLRVFSSHTVSSIGPKTVSAYTVKILSSQKRGGSRRVSIDSSRLCTKAVSGTLNR